jgi:hypothetical protein
MQSSIRTGGQNQGRLFNPLLDLAILGLEKQLKAWQTYQVEGTRFVAKRMQVNLEHLRSLCHCCDPQSMGDCQRRWLGDLQKDYAEEWGRITATTFALAFADLTGLTWLFGHHTPTEFPQAQFASTPQPAEPPKSQSSFAAAA